MRIQLWSYNYDPEPTGIGPVSSALARGLSEAGHEVQVIAAHPHYPVANWGVRLRPYRELRNDVPVLRLPLWIGRATAPERIRQELSFMTAQLLAAPLLGTPDVLISASPSFPALLPAVLNVRARRVPWVLWLHDILPDGATATGLVTKGPVLSASRWLERTAYAKANRIVVLSQAFISNLTAKGVPEEKLTLIYDPATRSPVRERRTARRLGQPLRVLSMGNIGHSQGLAPLVAAVESAEVLNRVPVALIIAGSGVAASQAAAEVRSPRVRMLGVVSTDRLEGELQAADIGLVSQVNHGPEFNIPSKLMNFMAYGLPVLASVHPRGEVARLITQAGAGWVVNSSDPAALPAKLAELAGQHGELARRGAAAAAFSDQHFSRSAFTDMFERELRDVVSSHEPARHRPRGDRHT